MSGTRKSAAALVAAIAGLGSVGVLVVATATPSAAAPPSCTDNWTNASGGTWNTAGNWSSGVPGSATVACIGNVTPGTYTVTETGSTSVGVLEVGGATSGMQTLQISGSGGSDQFSLQSAGSQIESGGVVQLASSSSGYADLAGTGGVEVASGGTLSTTGASSQAYFETPITNDAGGTIQIGAVDSRQDQSGKDLTNNGAFDVLSGGKYSVSGSSNFTDAAGTLVVTGTFDQSNGTFTQSGGAESGNPADLSGVTLADSAGAGSFVMLGSGTLNGTIPSGQTVTVSGASGSNQVLISTGLLVANAGTLSLSSSSSGYALIHGAGGVEVASGGTLSTTGASSQAYFETPITNDAGGTVTIGAADTRLDVNTATATNSGTWQVADGGHLAVSGGSSLTNQPAGTIGVTVDSSKPNAFGISGSNIVLGNGTLAVTTVGSPSVGSLWLSITGSTGTFGQFSFGPDYYVVTYPLSTTEVQLQFEQAFSATADSFSAAANQAVTTPQVATITANGEPGTYSATVDYGDGTRTQPATVSGTVVNGPTHTYTSPGTFTETVVISTTAGTTQTVSGPITVTGPTITGLSKTTVKSGKGLSTTVSGTGFDGTGAPSGFTTSDPTNVTITKVTFKAATKKKPASYKVKLKVAKTAPAESVNLTLTQTGTDPGSSTDVNAITIS